MVEDDESKEGTTPFWRLRVCSSRIRKVIRSIIFLDGMQFCSDALVGSA